MVLIQVVFCAFVCSVVVFCCQDVQMDQPYKDLNQMVVEANLVIAGYTRAVFQNSSVAEFLVFNTFKGEDLLTNLLQQKQPSALESALSRRMVNVSGFSCQSNVQVGETYILFINVKDQGMVNTVKSLVIYSRDKEDAIRDIIGSHVSWKDWSSCTRSCGGGVQERKRNCNGRSSSRKCSSEDGQERVCNTFPCIGLFDILQVTNIHQQQINSRSSHFVYHLSRNQTWMADSLSGLHRAFPLEFGLLFRSYPTQPGIVFQIVVSTELQFGLRLDVNNITLILSPHVQITFDSSIPWNSTWLQVAFSFRRNNITFYQNCKALQSTSVSAKIRPLLSRSASVLLGSVQNSSQVSYEGIIEQLILTESPDAAGKQCSSVVRPLMHLDSPSKNKAHDTKASSSLEKFFPEDEDLEGDEDSVLQERGSGLHGMVDKTIPLISEDDEHYVDDEDDIERSQDVSDDWNDLLDDEEERRNGNSIEGSGWSSQDALQWSDWSSCSHTCGWGTRSRTPFCRDNSIDIRSCSSATNKQREVETCFLGVCQTATTSAPTSFIVAIMTQAPQTSHVTTPASTTIGTTAIPCLLDCRNGAECNLEHTACQCAHGYFGKLCQHAVCVPSCKNLGTCVSPNKCICPSGYSGKACQRAMCLQGCQNGGRCIAPGQCACPSGYSGKQCDKPYCHPQCRNGGYCVKPFSCYCPAFTSGTFCEKLKCDPSCQNGGVCNSLGKCSCPQGFSGSYCEKVSCRTPCANGGLCNKRGKCACKTGFHGFDCRKRACQFTSVKEPYKRSYKQKVMSVEHVPCGPWGWKQCTKNKMDFVTVFKTFYRTTYLCIPVPNSVENAQQTLA